MFEEWLAFFFNGMQIFFLLFLGINIVYLFVFAVASLFPVHLHIRKDNMYRKIVVLIPGYKEDNVIVGVAKDALNQNYPQDRYDVVVIADSFTKITVESLQQLPVKVIEVSFDNSTKAKSLNKAMAILPEEYDIAVVLDADNLMAPDFLSRINDFFAARPVVAVQGHRIAKNMNTSFAVLDTVSEEINNQIFRKGHRVLGFSSAIIGSGIAFSYAFFKDLIAQISAIGGYDKEMEIRILKNRNKVYYLPDALVYDEKVQNAKAFSKQRRRWLSTQFHYVRAAFFDALTDLIRHGNTDYFNKVFQWLLMPRAIIIGLMFTAVPLFIALDLLISETHITSMLWGLLFILFVITFVFAIPQRYYTMQTLRAIGQLPQGVVLMIKNLFQLKGANRTFIHTEHGVPESSDVK